MTIHLRQFNAAADAISDNADQRAFLREGMRGYEQTREIAQDRFADWQAARSAAAEIKWDAIEHLEHVEGRRQHQEIDAEAEDENVEQRPTAAPEDHP